MTISLAAIEAADKAATPGPWQSDSQVRGDCVVWGPEEDQFILNAGGARREAPAFDLDKLNAELIALYRNETPALAQALRAVLALAEVFEDVPYTGPVHIDGNADCAECSAGNLGQMLRFAIEDAGVTP